MADGSSDKLILTRMELRSRGMKKLSGNPDSVGLCRSCRWSRAINSDRGSVFYQCARATTDPRYPRYPRLPVIACAGHESAEKSSEPGADSDANPEEPEDL